MPPAMLALMLRSIAAPSEHRWFQRLEALRCVSKHEGDAAAIPILRDARTPIQVCETPSACALLRMRTAERAARRRTVSVHSDLTMSNSPSRSRGAILRPGFATLLHSPRIEGGRSAEKRSGARRNTRGACRLASKTRVNALSPRHARRLARRLASHDAGRSPLGAPSWRFWAPGPRFRLLRRPPSYNDG
jgi:hypothetical protein